MHTNNELEDRTFLEGKLACANGVDRCMNPYVARNGQLATKWDPGWIAHAHVRARAEQIGKAKRHDELLVPLRVAANCSAYRDGRLARANGVEKSENPYVGSGLEMAYQWNNGWESHELARAIQDGRDIAGLVYDSPSWPFERIQTLDGQLHERIRSSIFIWGGLLALVAGVALILNDANGGGFLAITLAPCLFLYPLVRLLFGGKGGVLPVVATVVVEEVLKRQVFKALDKGEKRRRR